MKRLEDILRKYNYPKRKEKSDLQIIQIEKEINFLLPEDYKFYLKNYKGFEEFVGPELFALWDVNEILDWNKETGIFDNLPYTLGIGTNPSSEFIGIEFNPKKNYRIILSPLIDLDKEFHINIGNSFTDFFERLEQGKEWYD